MPECGKAGESRRGEASNACACHRVALRTGRFRVVASGSYNELNSWEICRLAIMGTVQFLSKAIRARI